MTATTGSSRARSLAGPLDLDSSALLKLYLPEPESDALNRRVRGRRDLLVSDLSVTEIVSALSRRRREGTVDTKTVTRLQRAVLDHVESGHYRNLPILPSTHREAERFLLTMEHVFLRAADALHLALAVSGEAACVLTYDTRMRAAVAAVGLKVFP